MNKRIIFIFLLIAGLGIKGWAQVINAPFIYCIEDSSSNGDITLYWENPANNPCGAFVQYNIFVSPTGLPGTFTQVASVTNQAATSYILSNTSYPGTSTWYFCIQCQYNCPGATVLSSDTVNNKPPVAPVIISVTVTPNNQSVITFAPSTSSQTSHYFLYYYLPNGHEGILWDTAYGINDTIVIDTTTNPQYNPGNYSQYFTIAAVDSCGNRSSFTDAAQNTILASATNTECQRQVNIVWNKYNNWPKGVKQYEVWISDNEGPFIEEGVFDSSTLNYPYTGFNTGDSLQIYIRAISAADTNVISNSNIVHMRAIIVQPPAYIYLTDVSVTAANDVVVSWTIDTMGQIIYYQLLQSIDSVDYYPEVQIPDSPLVKFPSFLDTAGVYPQNNPYYYEVDAYDSCQDQYPTKYGKTICLLGSLYDYYVAKLTWNNFVLSNATVAYYNLYRNVGSGFQLLKSFQPGVNQYFDSLQQFSNVNGTFCYVIEAVYYLSLPAPSGYHDTLVSSSNQVCVVSRPVIYVPNAFAPGGGVPENMVFKPTIIYGAPTAYSMIIYNRWGGKVFESNNPDIGWDGTDHGKEAEMGGYAYLIDFTAADGTPIQQKGIVLLVR